MRFYIFYIEVVYFWKKFMLEFFSWEKFEYGKNLRVSHSPYPKGPPKHPLYGTESKNFWGLLHLEHTFRTYILLTFRNYTYKLHL